MHSHKPKKTYKSKEEIFEEMLQNEGMLYCDNCSSQKDLTVWHGKVVCKKCKTHLALKADREYKGL